MDSNIIPFPAADRDEAVDLLDPVAARAQFFFDLELAELTAVIPQAEPVEGKQVY